MTRNNLAESTDSLIPGPGFSWLDTEPGVCAIGRFKNLTLIVWWSQATGQAVERVAQITRVVCEQHPEAISNIHVIKDKAALPTAEARSGFIRMMKDHAHQLANVAIVVGGTGFWASTMRSAITSMRFVTPRSFELRLHGSPSEILGWLPNAHRQRTRVELSRERLTRMLAEAERCADAGVVEPLFASPEEVQYSLRAPVARDSRRPR